MKFKKQYFLLGLTGVLLFTSYDMRVFAEPSNAVEKQKKLEEELSDKENELKTIKEQVSELDKQLAEVEEELEYYRLRVSNLNVAKDEHEKVIKDKQREIEDYKKDALLNDYYNMISSLDSLLFVRKSLLVENKPLTFNPSVGVLSQITEMEKELTNLRRVGDDIEIKKSINEEYAKEIDSLFTSLSDKLVERIQLEKKLQNEKEMTEQEMTDLKNQLQFELRQKSMNSFLVDRGDLHTDTGDKIVSIAKKYLGVPYVWGGTSSSGLDCSGLVLLVMKQVGIDPPRNSAVQATFGKKVDLSEIQPGDLLFFDTARVGHVTHVGIYIGDGKLLHAPQEGDIVKIVPLGRYWETTFVTARRYH